MDNYNELIEISREIFTQGLDKEVAVKTFISQVDRNKKLRRVALGIAGQELWHNFVIRNVRAGINQSSVESKDEEKFSGPTDEDIEVITQRRTAADWPIWNSKKIRDATREELLHQMEVHKAHIVGNSKSYKWIKSIVDRLNPNEMVREKLNDDEINRLHDLVYKKEEEEELF